MSRRRTEADEAPRWQGATTENRGPRRAWFARWGGNIGQYLREEQRSQRRGPRRGSRAGVERGCIAGRMQPDFYHGLLWLGPGQHEMLDLVGGRKPAARSEGAAIQRRDGVRVAQDILDIPVRKGEATGGEGPAKGVARARAVDAIDRKGRRPDLTPVAPGEAALGAEGDADQRRAKIPRHALERAPQIFVPCQRRREFLGRNDHIDVLQEIVDARPHFFDVDDRGNPGLSRVTRGL